MNNMSDLLSLPDIKTIEPPQENETDMMFKVEAVGPPERCPECGFDKLYKHSSRNQLIMDLPIRLKRVGLQLNRRRYKCRECGSTFWERLISVDEKRVIRNIRNICSHTRVLYDLSYYETVVKKGVVKISDEEKNSLSAIIKVISYFLQQISANRANDFQNNLKELFLRHSDNERIMKIIKDKSKISLVE